MRLFSFAAQCRGDNLMAKTDANSLLFISMQCRDKALQLGNPRVRVVDAAFAASNNIAVDFIYMVGILLPVCPIDLEFKGFGLDASRLVSGGD